MAHGDFIFQKADLTVFITCAHKGDGHISQGIIRRLHG